MSNMEIAELFRKMAATYQILGENRFKIIAYERAADSIEHLTSEVKDLWDDGKLSEIPGAGTTIVSHLDELFRTGHIRHIESVLDKVPKSVFPLLSVPGIGPKKAYKLVKVLKLDNEKNAVEQLKKAVEKHRVASIEGFGEKSEADILQNIATYIKGATKEKRILLSEADAIAQNLIQFLKKKTCIHRVDVLGSLRRSVATIGDIDIAIHTNKPEEAITYFCTYPHMKIIEQGPTGASILLHNGRQVDLRVQDKTSYGAMLQYFTGSKHHNIQLRTYALTKGMSLSEYGIKQTRRLKTEDRRQNDAKIIPFSYEKDFYEYLGMQWIPPELREDKGEIAAALKHTLPQLVELTDIKGDLHIHTSYDLQPSHDLGVNSLAEVLDKAKELQYEYIGISDHNPSVGNHTDKEIIEIMEKRRIFYEKELHQWNTKNHTSIKLFIMLEVDIKPDGTLALPLGAFDFIDAAIVSVHSSFVMDKKDMTTRIKKALIAHPKVKVLGHPTGRLLGRREGYDADWKELFNICNERSIALEINASPYRLDLTDALVYDAHTYGCRCIINTDSHSVPEMSLMKYGVSVARRGWSEKRDIVNCLGYNEIRTWMGK